MFEKYLSLLRLIQIAGGTIDGRKKLQKIVYLVQQRGGPFFETFQYYLYGPFSEQLANEVEEMKSFGLVHEVEVNAVMGQSKYKYSLSEAGKDLLAASGIDDRFQFFEDLIRELAKKDARQLELLATVLFLLKLKYSEEDIQKTIKRLKSSQGYTSDEISESITYLSERGFIGSNRAECRSLDC